MISFLQTHRVASIASIVLLTILLGWFALHLKVDSGAEAVLPSSGKDLRDLREFNATFGADEVIVVAAHSERLFTSEGLTTIGRLTEQMGKLPDVTRVLSPTNVKDLDGDELGPFPLVPYEKVRSGEWKPEALGEYLAAHPLFGGLLVSRDARTAALLLDVKRVEGDSRYRERMVRQVRDLVKRADRSMQFHVAGIPVEKSDIAAYIKRDQRIFAPLILGLFAVVTLVLYRHPVGVVIPLAVVGVSLVWTLGIYAAAGRSLNPVTSLMTPVILVCSVEGAIHLLNHYLFMRSSGRTKAEALEEAYRLCKVPCFNAAFTTAVGFGSLLFLPIPALHDFGIFTALGVMLAYLLTMVLAPLLLAILPDFPARVRQSFEKARLETLLGRAVRAVVGHPRISAAAAMLVLGVSLAGIPRIRVETDFIRALRPDAPLSRSTQFIDQHLTGVNSLEIVAHGISVTDAGALARLARFEAVLRDLPGIRQVTGYPDLAARVNRALHQGRDDLETLPSGPEAAADLADIHDLLHEQAPADLARFVAPSGDLRLAARVTALDTGASQRLFGRIREAARAAGLSRVTLTGNFVVLSNLSTSLVANEVQGLIPAMVVIFGAMILQFRSLRLGLLSIVPSSAPILMAYGLMGWTGIPLSVPTAMIAGIAIGMTVDNTIHLLAHFREEFAHKGDSLSALTAMVDACGRAVVYSTLIVSGGFLVGTFSSFRPSVHFAFLTGATLLFGLACEAVLLPLTLLFYRPSRGELEASAARARRAAFGMVVVLAIFAAAGSAQAAPEGRNLLDQYGRPDDPARHRGAPLLLIYGQPPDLRKMKSWEVKTRDKAGTSLAVLRAVDARSVKGKKTPEEVNARLQQNVPKEIALLVDWEGELARAYSLPAGQVSATLLDPAGKVCLTASGPVNDATLQELLDTLARVREKGACR